MSDINSILDEAQTRAEGKMLSDLGIKYPIAPDLYPEGLSSYLCDRQWGQSWVTRNLKLPNDTMLTQNNLTMISLNSSMGSYPEINYYYYDKFLKLDWLYSKHFQNEKQILDTITTYNTSINNNEHV